MARLSLHVPDKIATELRLRAATNGTSIDEEVEIALAAALAAPVPGPEAVLVCSFVHDPAAGAA